MANNVVQFNPAQVPAYVKANNGTMSALTKALTGGGSGGGFGKRISIRGGVFRLMSDGKQVASIDERYLDVVIVNAAPKVSRTYFEGTYNEENPSAPVCWSVDGTLPAPECKTKQALNCASCLKNEKGSGQGDTRACRFNQRLAVVLANDIEGSVMQMQLSATSIFGKEEGENRPLQAYANYLNAQGVVANQVITRMKFDTASASYPKLFFKAMRWLTEDEHDAAVAKGETADAKAAVTLTVTQVDKVLNADGTVDNEPFAPEPEEKPAPPPKASKKASAAPVDDDGDEKPVAEPTKRKAAETPTVSNSKLMDAIGDW